MAITGTGTSTIRKRDLSDQKSVAVSFKNLRFMHKAAAGETGISVSNLTQPSVAEVGSFTNPSTADILAANLTFVRDNIEIISSSKGVLAPYQSFTVATNSQINWVGFTTDVDEIFTVTVKDVPRSGLRVVDATPINTTGVLSSGLTTFNVGTSFEVGKYISTQIGAVIVFVDGVQQFRNTGNSSTTLDGNYYEVPVLGGLGSQIEFNTPVGFDRNILVVSNGMLVEKPELSQIAEIERVQGQLDALTPTVAALAGVPESDFTAAPTNIDLKQFGDRLAAAERYRVISSAYTASGPTDLILADTSGGAFTIDLPAVADARVGDRIVIIDMTDSFGTNTLTVGLNGHTAIDGTGSDFTMSTDGIGIELVFCGSGVGPTWRVGTR